MPSYSTYCEMDRDLKLLISFRQKRNDSSYGGDIATRPALRCKVVDERDCTAHCPAAADADAEALVNEEAPAATQPMVQPNNADASQTDTATADQQQPDDDAVATRKRLSHPQDIFRVNCRCTDCLQYRETAIQLLIEDVEYAILWKQLLKLLYGYYDMVPPKTDVMSPYPEHLFANTATAAQREPPTRDQWSPVPSTSAAAAAAAEAAAKGFQNGDGSNSGQFTSDEARQTDGERTVQLAAAKFSRTHEMTFILVSSLLFRRDPHHLFEQLCLQVRNISIMYRNMFKHKLQRYTGPTTIDIQWSDAEKPPSSNAEPSPAAANEKSTPLPSSGSICDHCHLNNNEHSVRCGPEDLVTFLLDGYDDMCNAARVVTPLMFELQRGHMQEFALTWNLLNKRMYQRYVYSTVKDLIPECILRLRQALEPDAYRRLVYRFIKFDDEMTYVTFKWREVWSLLSAHELSAVEDQRRTRVRIEREILGSIKQTSCNLRLVCHDAADQHTNKKQHAFDWLYDSDRQLAWAYMVFHMRTSWTEQHEAKATHAQLTPLAHCEKCKEVPATHAADCICRTCSMFGSVGPRKWTSMATPHCIYCTQFATIKRDYLQTVTQFIDDESAGPAVENPGSVGPTVDAISSHRSPRKRVHVPTFVYEDWLKENSYHLAWAVFSHLPNRVPYTSPKLVPQHFCSFQDPPCARNECRVATQIIAGMYPINFSKFLINTYQPVIDDDSNGAMHLHLAIMLRKLCAGDPNALLPSPLRSHAPSAGDTGGPAENGCANNGVNGAGAENGDAAAAEPCPSHMPDNLPFSLDDLFSVVDYADHTLLGHIGSAFTECYLTDKALPVADLLGACFRLTRHRDIQLNIAWLESMYGEQDDDVAVVAPPPKTKELAVRGTLSLDEFLVQQFGTKCSMAQSLRDDAELEANEMKPLIERLLRSPALMQNRAHLTEVVEHSCRAVLRSGQTGEHLSGAIQVAVNHQLNSQLEVELNSLKIEHNALKTMVSSLESIKDNDVHTVQTTSCAWTAKIESPAQKCHAAAKAKAKAAKSRTAAASAAAAAAAPAAEAPARKAPTVKAAVLPPCRDGGGGQECCADHGDAVPPEHPSKMCYRHDSQCSCYYCTIFGHTDCNHGRTNETRDRLRKRLLTKEQPGPSKVTPPRKKPSRSHNDTEAASAPNACSIAMGCDNCTPPSLDLAKMLAYIDADIALCTGSTNGNAAAAAAAAVASSRVPAVTTPGKKTTPNASDVKSPTTATTTPTTKSHGTQTQRGYTATSAPNGSAAISPAAAAAAAASSGGVKRKLQPPVVQQTQNVTVNNAAVAAAVCCGGAAVGAVAPAAGSCKKEAGICALKDDQYRIKKALPKKSTPTNRTAASTVAAALASRSAAATLAATGAAAQTPPAAFAGPAVPPPATAATPATVQMRAAPPPAATAPKVVMGDQHIDTLVKYIENPTESGGAAAKRDQEKKAAKKERQKLKRECDKKMEELDALRQQFHEVMLRDSETKADLKKLKTGGKKDKKRLAELEGLTKKYAKQRGQQEAVILELIAEVKAINSEFKFAYLPSKEQLQELHQTKTTAAQLAASGGAAAADVVSVARIAEPLAPIEVPPSVVGAADGAVPVRDDALATGGGSPPRTLTIRRELCETDGAHVTITDQNQVLYRIINGQVIVDGAGQIGVTGGYTGRNIMEVSLTDMYHKQHEELRQLNAQARSGQAAASLPVRTAPASPSPSSASTADCTAMAAAAAGTAALPETTATKCTGAKPKIRPVQLTGKAGKKAEKKAEKRERKADAALKMAAQRERQQQQQPHGDADDASSMSSSFTGPDTGKPPRNMGTGAKGKGCGTPRSKNDDTSSMSSGTMGKHSRAKGRVGKGAAAKTDKDVDELQKHVHKLDIKTASADGKPTKERRKVKAKQIEYADPNYRCNAFDVLDMDDDDYEVSDPDSSEAEAEPAHKARAKTLPPNNTSGSSPYDFWTPREAAFTTVRASKNNNDKGKAKVAAAPTNAKQPQRTPGAGGARAASGAATAAPHAPATPAARPAAKPAARADHAKKATPRQAKHSTASSTASSSTWEPAAAYVRPAAVPQPIEIQLSKKQLKKLAQQQSRQAAASNVASNAAGNAASNAAAQKAARGQLPSAPTQHQHQQPHHRAPRAGGGGGGGGTTGGSSGSSFVNPSETMAQTLKNSMQRLSLNDDTTIELVRNSAQARQAAAEQHRQILANQLALHQNQLQQPQPNDSDESIIDQLEAGVQMEVLKLPPGITITRCRPEQSEQLDKQKETIEKLAQPMQPAAPDAQMPHAIIPLGGNNNAGGIIMVETARLHQQQQQQQQQQPDSHNSPTPNRTRRRRRNGNNDQQQQQQPVEPSADVAQPQVTLRNPLFQQRPMQPNAAQQPSLMMGSALGGGAAALPLPAMDAPASIIRNANGMFTIRNSAMHQALHQQMPLNMMMPQAAAPPPVDASGGSFAAAAAAAAAVVANQGARSLSAEAAYYSQNDYENTLRSDAAAAGMQSMSVPPPALVPIARPPTTATGLPSMSEPPPNMGPYQPAQLAPQQRPQSVDRSGGLGPSSHSTPDNFSYFTNNNAAGGAAPAPPASATSASASAIGSELKSAKQRKQQEIAWQQQQLQSNAGQGGGAAAASSTNFPGNNAAAISAAALAAAAAAATNRIFSNFGPRTAYGNETQYSHFNIATQQQQQQQQQASAPQPSAGNATRRDFFGFTATSNNTNAANNADTVRLGADAGASGGFGLFSPPSASTSGAASDATVPHRQRREIGGNTFDDYYGTQAAIQELQHQQQQAQQQAAASGGSRLDFYSNLQPGHRLNSEVTIHNVNEAKFNRNADTTAATDSRHARNGVEITPIPSGFQSQRGNHSFVQPQQHQQRQQQQPMASTSGIGNSGWAEPQQSQRYNENAAASHLTLQSSAYSNFGNTSYNNAASNQPGSSRGAAAFMGTNEYSDNSIFAPNQQVPLSDLRSEDRDIELFKRTVDSIKPAVVKPKIEFDVKNITLPPRRPPASTSATSSPAPAAAASSSESSSSPFCSSETASQRSETASQRSGDVAAYRRSLSELAASLLVETGDIMEPLLNDIPTLAANNYANPAYGGNLAYNGAYGGGNWNFGDNVAPVNLPPSNSPSNAVAAAAPEPDTGSPIDSRDIHALLDNHDDMNADGQVD